MRRMLAGCVAAALIAVMQPGAAFAAAPTTRVVDDDGAQCGNAEFRTIGDAVLAANPGDTVRVCAGVYRERVDVTKPLRLIGQRDAVESVYCFDETWAPTDPVDPAVFPVIEPPDGEIASLVRLQADGIELAGFVVQGQSEPTDPALGKTIFEPAVQADRANAGHWIHHNLFQKNTFGIELGSNGSMLSRVDHNCLRGNEWAVANQRYTTDNVRVDHNEAFRTRVIPFEVGSTLGGISDPRFIRNARFDHNRSVGSGFAAYLVDRAESVELDHNVVEAPAQGGNGIYVRGENKDVAITDNELSGTPTADTGIRLAIPTANAPQASVQLVVARNTVQSFNLGILLGAARTTDTQILENLTVANRTSGIQVNPTNTSALVQGNISNNNLYGIRTSTSAVMGNRFVGNSMHSNGVGIGGFDAVESSFTTTDGVTTLNNTWQSNLCDTDSPTDTICGR